MVNLKLRVLKNSKLMLKTIASDHQKCETIAESSKLKTVYETIINVYLVQNPKTAFRIIKEETVIIDLNYVICLDGLGKAGEGRLPIYTRTRIA